MAGGLCIMVKDDGVILCSGSMMWVFVFSYFMI